MRRFFIGNIRNCKMGKTDGILLHYATLPFASDGIVCVCMDDDIDFTWMNIFHQFVRSVDHENNTYHQHIECEGKKCARKVSILLTIFGRVLWQSSGKHRVSTANGDTSFFPTKIHFIFRHFVQILFTSSTISL